VRLSHLTALVVLASVPALAAEWSGSARGQISAGVDTNPGRDFISDGGTATPDGFAQAIVNLAGGVDVGPLSVDATYDFGGRKFVTQPQDDTIIQSASVFATVFMPRGFSLGLEGRARDRRGAERDYTDLMSDLVLGYAPDNQLDFRLRGGYHRFLFWVEGGFRESFWAPEAGLTVRYRFNKHHSISFFGDYSYRTYNSPIYELQVDGSVQPDPGTVRVDPYFAVGASYSYKGPVNVTLSYSYIDNTGTQSYGEKYSQHRIGLLFGVAIPWDLTFLLNGQLRFSNYPDGIFFSADILTLMDDENLSSVSAKLMRPIGEHVEVDLRYAFYYGTLPQNGFLYLRHTASVGVSVHF
jgi:hypothetical protein